jgi:hypothetical protein
MRANLFAILCLAILAMTVTATVFEAESSDDVDLFLTDFEDETIALLFYDSSTNNKDDQDWFARLSSKVLGIFMSSDQYGRSTEDWVEMFDDKLHLMRVDAKNGQNLRSREEFNIVDAPFIVMMDHRRTILREKMDDETYDHVRMLLDRRPNILHKTGGAALKSFNLEPDADAPETAPRVIQYFDLTEGAPTNVEAPIQNQYVNWAPVDVIGPDGKWEERGRDWVTSYEIPESGINGQKDSQRVAVQERIRDDPRPIEAPKPAPVAAPVQPAPVAPVQPAPVAPAQPARVAAPAQPVRVAALAQPARVAAPVQLARVAAPSQPIRVAAPAQPARVAAPSQPIRVAAPAPQATRPVQYASAPQATRPVQYASAPQGARQVQFAPTQQATRPVQYAPVQQATRPTSAPQGSVQTRLSASAPQTTSTRTSAAINPTAQPTAQASTSAPRTSAPATSTSGQPQRAPYHSTQYTGFGEYGSDRRSYN